MVKVGVVSPEHASGSKLKSAIHVPCGINACLERSLMISQRSIVGRESHVVLAVGESERLAYSPILSCARRRPEGLGLKSKGKFYLDTPPSPRDRRAYSRQ